MKETYHKVIKYTQTPIQFYAVIIIVLISSIGFLAWLSKLPSNLTMWIIGFLIIVVIVIIILVSYLLITSPSKLVLGKEEYITIMREKLGDSEKGERYYSIDIAQREPPKSLPEAPEQGNNEVERE